MRTIIKALLARRSALAEECQTFRVRLSEHTATVEAIDGQIRALEPGFNFCAFGPATRPEPAAQLFQPREALFIALDRLLEAGTPLSTTDLTDIVIRQMGVELHRPEYEALNRRLHKMLENKRREGVIRRVGRKQGANRSVLWEMI